MAAADRVSQRPAWIQPTSDFRTGKPAGHAFLGLKVETWQIFNVWLLFTMNICFDSITYLQ